jgi:ACS family hexuronate transporter-like MFS transporter
MDRQTLSNTSQRITREFGLNEEQYGTLETAFSLAFAVGASIFGVIADRTSVRWLYPTVLLLWSAMGFATGLVETYAGLLVCRTLLGLFEAGHWPCALKTTQRLLPSDRRTLGNSVLQSGTAIGAMVTPLIIKKLLTEEPGSWRPAFQIVGAVGIVWVVLWRWTMGKADFESPDSKPQDGESQKDSQPTVPESSFLTVVVSRKFLALIIVVVAINLSWHQFRVWMQKFLINGKGYSELASLDINFWFNVMTDVGCLSAGFASALLFRNGVSAHWARVCVFSVCSLMVTSGIAIPWLPAGPELLAVLMIVGAGLLGLFPCYYAFTQELSLAHQGKISGTLGTIAWIFPAMWHWQFGRWVDKTGSYDLGMSVVCIMPLMAIVALILMWPTEKHSSPNSA